MLLPFAVRFRISKTYLPFLKQEFIEELSKEEKVKQPIFFYNSAVSVINGKYSTIVRKSKKDLKRTVLVIDIDNYREDISHLYSKFKIDAKNACLLRSFHGYHIIYSVPDTLSVEKYAKLQYYVINKYFKECENWVDVGSSYSKVRGFYHISHIKTLKSTILNEDYSFKPVSKEFCDEYKRVLAGETEWTFPLWDDSTFGKKETEQSIQDTNLSGIFGEKILGNERVQVILRELDVRSDIYGVREGRFFIKGSPEDIRFNFTQRDPGESSQYGDSDSGWSEGIERRRFPGYFSAEHFLVCVSYVQFLLKTRNISIDALGNSFSTDGLRSNSNRNKTSKEQNKLIFLEILRQVLAIEPRHSRNKRSQLQSICKWLGYCGVCIANKENVGKCLLTLTRLTVKGIRLQFYQKDREVGFFTELAWLDDFTFNHLKPEEIVFLLRDSLNSYKLECKTPKQEKLHAIVESNFKDHLKGLQRFVAFVVYFSHYEVLQLSTELFITFWECNREKATFIKKMVTSFLCKKELDYIPTKRATTYSVDYSVLKEYIEYSYTVIEPEKLAMELGNGRTWDVMRTLIPYTVKKVGKEEAYSVWSLAISLSNANEKRIRLKDLERYINILEDG